MNIVLIDVDAIEPNPFQPREAEDPEHIRQLAASITEDGLMQAPLGRRVDGQRVQLAFGHSRLAAWKLLREGRAGYEQMPVNIQELTDLQMFEKAVRENNDRRGLNPIERAKAMETYATQFHKTSEEIGKLWHLGDSTVRNIRRLLNLPADLQELVATGTLAEGVGRALLGLFAIDEGELEKASGFYYGDLRPDAILQTALSGTPANVISEQISRLKNSLEQEKEMQLEAAQASKPAAPAPAPIPAPSPAPARPQPRPSPATEPVEEPAPEPAKPLTWEESTIVLTVTYWPGQDGSRMVMIGGRANQNAPLIRPVIGGLALSEPLQAIFDDIRSAFVENGNSNGGEA